MLNRHGFGFKQGFPGIESVVIRDIFIKMGSTSSPVSRYSDQESFGIAPCCNFPSTACCLRCESFSEMLFRDGSHKRPGRLLAGSAHRHHPHYLFAARRQVFFLQFLQCVIVDPSRLDLGSKGSHGLFTAQLLLHMSTGISRNLKSRTIAGEMCLTL